MTTKSNMFFMPESGSPYSGFRSAFGTHKRSYTMAALVVSGMIQWNEKEGKVSGFAKGSDVLASTLMGKTAWNYWRRTKEWIDRDGLTESGRVNVANSLIGKAHLEGIPGLVSAYVRAMHSGELREPGTGNLIETFRHSFPNPTAPKGTKGTTDATKGTKGTTDATKGTKGTKLPPILITPEAK